MKKIVLLSAVIAFSIANAAAQYKFPPLDKSVADIVYYPLMATHDGKPPMIKIVYSRPLKNGRLIFGDTGALQPFGKVWRVGANEDTEIKFYVPVTIGGKQIPAGTYSLYAIPGKDSWTMIINSALDRWGLFYDRDKLQEKDIVRFSVPVKTLDNVLEALAITFTPLPNGANMIIGWDKTAVEVPVIFQ